MTFQEFVARHGAIPRYTPPGTPGWLDRIDAECHAMAVDYPPVTSWDKVNPGTPVFIRWCGGNRGMYVRLRHGIGIPGDNSWPVAPLPQLDIANRCRAAAWIDVGAFGGEVVVVTGEDKP